MRRIERQITYLLLFAAVLLSAACGRAELTEHTRLPGNVSIDGIDVSRMTATDASALLHAHHAELIQDTVFTLSLPHAQLTVPAGELGVTADIRTALLRAASLRRGDEKRNVMTEWILPSEHADAYAQHVAAQHSVAPKNASVQTDFSKAEPFTFLSAKPGHSVQPGAVRQALYDAVASRQNCALSVPADTLAPTVTLPDVQQDKQRIAQYTTSYAAYPYNKSNRVFNIQKATALINGTVLEPGETFDCNAVLGDRTEENGWRTATGIRNGTYVNEYGGGVCQVSSTLFNAVLMADLSIIERHPHSWPMGYVDIGRDATISTGGKNLIFVNSSTGTLYIHALTDNASETVTVSFYGVPRSDGVSISLSSELVSRLPDEGMEIRLDESLPAGSRVVMRESRRGCISRTYKSFHAADGALLSRTLAYEDVYRSIQGVTHVSTDIYYS